VKEWQEVDTFELFSEIYPKAIREKLDSLVVGQVHKLLHVYIQSTLSSFASKSFEGLAILGRLIQVIGKEQVDVVGV
jgi:hypothetical protein